MLNPEAAELSRQALPLQLENLRKSYPFFRVIYVADSSYDCENAVCAKMDYYNWIDATALDLEGRAYNIQLKAREPGNNDLVFIVRHVTDADMVRNPHLGFTFNGEKYSFVLNNIDIFCEMINGIIYNVRVSDLMALEFDTGGENNPFIKNVCRQEYIDSTGNKFRSGNFYAFISVEKIIELKERLLKAENREYYEYTHQQEQ